MTSLLRSVAMPLIRAARRSGIRIDAISTIDRDIAGLRVQWRDDDHRRVRGTVVNAEIDGQNICFLVANERDLIQREHFHGKFYEKEELAIIARHFAGGVFVDVGSNVGNHAIFALKFLHATKVIAFEPNPEALRILKVNIALNGLPDRMVIHEVGLSATPGEAFLSVPLNNLGAARLSRSNGGGTFELARGDDILRGERVDFIKIDTEGLELEVLQGLTDTIRQNRPTLFVEVDETNVQKFEAFCSSLDYRIDETFKRYDVNTNFLVKPEMVRSSV